MLWSLEIRDMNAVYLVSKNDDFNKNLKKPIIFENCNPSTSIFVRREDREANNIIEPLHKHDFIEIVYILAGSSIQNINGKEHKVQKGDVLYFKIGDSHSYKAKGDLKLVNCIILPSAFSNGLVDQTYQTFDIPNIIHLPSEHIMEFEYIIKQIEEEFAKKLSQHQIILKSYLSVLLNLLIRYASNNNRHKNNHAINEILEYIEKDFTKVTLNDLSKEFSYSPSYLSKFFKNHTGKTFSQYINDKRMEKAIALITTTDLTIDKLCLQLGYNGKNQFYKMFKEYTGTTPNNIRKQIK